MYHTVTCKVYLIPLYCHLLVLLLTAETHRHGRKMHAYTHTPETCAYHTVTCKVCLMYSH